MPGLKLRRILVALLLVIAAFAAILSIGAAGLGEKVGAPGLDRLVSRIFERLRFHEGTGPMPETTTLPSNIREVAGTWSGVSDVDGTVWQFTFEEDFAVRASSSSGYSYDGTAFVHWKRGLTEGHLRVPPGWNVLDVDTINSSEPSHRNMVSLGAYSLRRDLLKYCFSEPGKMVRPINDLSREGIRCFDLTRGTAAPTGAGKEPRPAAIPGTGPLPAATEPSQRVRATAIPPSLIAGRAEIIIDGSRETWPLRTDRDSATDLADPRRLTLQFQAHGGAFPAARRIELAIDATRTGEHRADGFVYLENLFIREKVPVGSEKAGAPEAIFLYIAEGGRIFPPQHTCELLVTKSHGGGKNMLLEGSLAGCVVSSAGEDHTIEASFSVKGSQQ